MGVRYTDMSTIKIEELNPTFLYFWKGIKEADELKYESHDYAELAYVLSGQCGYRIDNKLYQIAEGDLVIINPSVKHQFCIL